MGNFSTLLLVLVASSAFAGTNGYDLKMDLSMNGKHVSSPHVSTKEGEKATITQDSNGEKLFVDVVATEKLTNNKRGILMKFVVGTITANGDKKILSKPQIVAIENEEAQINVGHQPGKDEISLSVIAIRKSL